MSAAACAEFGRALGAGALKNLKKLDLWGDYDNRLWSSDSFVCTCHDGIPLLAFMFLFAVTAHAITLDLFRQNAFSRSHSFEKQTVLCATEQKSSS
jgi:hypothetical protein